MDDYSAYISKISLLKDDLSKALEFVNWKQQVRRGSTVFIKPNFTYPYYKEGITTSPELLKNLLEIIGDRADRVIIGESDGGNHSFSADDSFKGHNMLKICKETGAELINLSKIQSVPVDEKVLGERVKILLPKLLLEDVDCFISVPVLKVHVMTGVTLSIKNLWGCYPDTMRCLHHKHLSRKLSLITKSLKPKLVIIDGIFALDGHGPMYGKPIRTDLIISSNNSVVADSLGAAVMGIPLKCAEYILIAERLGLGTTDLEQVRMNSRWEKFKMDFEINKTLMDNISKLLFNSEFFSKLILDSSLTPLLYGMARYLRTAEEQEVISELERYH